MLRLKVVIMGDRQCVSLQRAPDVSEFKWLGIDRTAVVPHPQEYFFGWTAKKRRQQQYGVTILGDTFIIVQSR